MKIKEKLYLKKITDNKEFKLIMFVKLFKK